MPSRTTARAEARSFLEGLDALHTELHVRVPLEPLDEAHSSFRRYNLGEGVTDAA